MEECKKWSLFFSLARALTPDAFPLSPQATAVIRAATGRRDTHDEEGQRVSSGTVPPPPFPVADSAILSRPRGPRGRCNGSVGRPINGINGHSRDCRGRSSGGRRIPWQRGAEHPVRKAAGSGDASTREAMLDDTRSP